MFARGRRNYGKNNFLPGQIGLEEFSIHRTMAIQLPLIIIFVLVENFPYILPPATIQFLTHGLTTQWKSHNFFSSARARSVHVENRPLGTKYYEIPYPVYQNKHEFIDQVPCYSSI